MLPAVLVAPVPQVLDQFLLVVTVVYVVVDSLWTHTNTLKLQQSASYLVW